MTTGHPPTRTSATALRAAAARIEREAPAFAARVRREADQMDAAGDAQTYWLDHTGARIGPAPAGDPTGWEELRKITHRIMRPQPGQLIQAVSWCGRRVSEVPGRGPVDCPDCVQLIAEDHAMTTEGLP